MKTDLGLRKLLALETHRLMHRNHVKTHDLRTLFWECTLRCNAACRHCGSDCRVSAAQPDMPLADFLKVVDLLAPHVDRHRLLVILTGGEPLMRPDIEECGRELYHREFPWAIVSNGRLFPERMDGLLRAGLRSATISLDGFEEQHQWMRRIPNGFACADQSIRLLAQTRGVVWDVVTCANRRNFDTLPELRRYLQSIGVSRWRIFTVFPVGRAAANPDLQLDDDQFVRLMEFIVACRRDGFEVSYGCEGFLGRFEAEARPGFYECSAGVAVASVLADGSISGCPSIRADYHQGNIYRDDFWQVWNEGFQNYRHREWMRKGVCADCRLYRYCEGNGMHLRDGEGNLLLCHYHRIEKG